MALALWLGGDMAAQAPSGASDVCPGQLRASSTLAGPTMLPLKAAQTAAIRASAKIQRGRRSDVQFTQYHPSTQKAEFLKNSNSTKHSGGFKGFCLWFSRGFFFLHSWWESLCL